MTTVRELKELWLEISDVALPIASLRDEYAKGSLMNERFRQLSQVYANLNEIEQALSEFMERKKFLFGRKTEREFFMLARPSVANAKILLEIATDEFVANRRHLTTLATATPTDSMRASSPATSGGSNPVVHHKLDALRLASNDPALSAETRERSKRALELGQAALRHHVTMKSKEN